MTNLRKMLVSFEAPRELKGNDIYVYFGKDDNSYAISKKIFLVKSVNPKDSGILKVRQIKNSIDPLEFIENTKNLNNAKVDYSPLIKQGKVYFAHYANCPDL